MMPPRELRSAFEEAVAGGWTTGADRLCRCCVELLEVDGAALSLMTDGQSWGTLGASGDLSRRVDELQFTFGEGPCMDAVTGSAPVLVADLGHVDESRWPAFSGAVLKLNIRAVFALPVVHGREQVGALDLYRHQPGRLSAEAFGGSLLAAEAAAVPLLQVMRETAAAETDDEIAGRQASATSWERVEVYQATGMIMGQLAVGRAEALLRLRGYAFSHGMTATEVAIGVIDRSVVLADDDTGGRDGGRS